MTAPPHGLYGAPIAMPWQTILADLALILFMMTAAALANAPDAPLLPNAVKPPAPSAQGEPVGVWREGPGMPRLAEWLAQQARDPRLRVSILVRHRAGHEQAALTHAQALVAEAGVHAASARIVVEPGREDTASVVLAYDAQ
ncbi:hypothetical protein NSE01_36120 [Novosphingobium sediminis]|uniref:Uncharacterized protein n=1 Tax=Novosphingobium sediminis TaxID=707214 RepID=A0A512AQ13_9SPHN|nr:hypothetical protein [Novosphingobium sediminis]GEO01780.1 hypothetical protein NSE01_36120 [Novosphingobium sediminis]